MGQYKDPAITSSPSSLSILSCNSPLHTGQAKICINSFFIPATDYTTYLPLQGALPAKVPNPPLAAILSPSSPIILSQSLEPFTPRHSEGTKRLKNLLFTPFRASAHQGKLREGAAKNLVTLKLNPAKGKNYGHGITLLVANRQNYQLR